MRRAWIVLISLLAIVTVACRKNRNASLGYFEAVLVCPEWCDFMVFSVGGVTDDDVFIAYDSQGDPIPRDAKPGEYVFIPSCGKFAIRHSNAKTDSVSRHEDGSASTGKSQIVIMVKAAKPKNPDDSVFSYSCASDGNSSEKRVVSHSVCKDGDVVISLSSENGRHVIEPSRKNGSWYSASGVEALYDVGNAYFFGENVRKDVIESVKWFVLAAEYGHVGSMMDLAGMYYKGEAVAQDYAKAAKWYERAANAGNVDAMYNLGSMHVDGNGVAKDYDKASEWWERAAEHGNVKAMYNLGSMYYYGIGTAQNLIKAGEWYQRAAALGDENAKYRLDEILGR